MFPKAGETMAVTRNVSLPDDQNEWVNKHYVSLSKLLQAAISREMESNKQEIAHDN